MTDSLARIRAERDADEERYRANPEAIRAGEMAARAAERCARKRAIWAADHCDGCPFSGCPSCRYKGGIDPQTPRAEATNQLVPWENRGGKDERPRTGIRDLSEPPRFDQTEQEGLPTW